VHPRNRGPALRRCLRALPLVASAVAACVERPGITAPPIVRVGYYVDTRGSSAGDGSWQKPWDMATALAGARGQIHPGDTVWLRGGRYAGPFTSSLTGTPGAPVIVRQYPGERATLDNTSPTAVTLHITGSNAWYWGFEVTNSSPDRNVSRPNGVYPTATDTKMINLVVHDNAVGVSLASESGASEVYGCLIYDNGFSDTSGAHGHGIYTKNDGQFQKVIRDNIVFDQFRNGIQIFTDSGTDLLKNYLLDGNVWFNNGALTSTSPSDGNILVGGWEPADQIAMRHEMTYFSAAIDAKSVRIGYHNTLQNGTVTLANGYFVGGNPVLTIGYWDTTAVSGNLLVGTAQMLALNDSAHAGQSWSSNIYDHDPAATAWAYGGTSYTFAGWQLATGLGSTDQAQAVLPAQPQVFVRSNLYETGRANIIVFNWTRQGSVAVDVSGILQPGAHYELHNVQDFYGTPVLSGTYTGGSISIPMTGVQPPRPIGGSPNAAPRTSPDFDVFVLITSPT
jgi:hypothetical protein